MRRSLFPLVIGFAAGVLGLGIFLTSTGRVNLNRNLNPTGSPPATNLPPLSSELPTAAAQPVNAPGPEPPDPSTFAPPITERPLPPLAKFETPSIAAAPSPAPPDPSVFKPMPSVGQDDVQALESKNLMMPIAGLKPANILDTFNDKRGSGRKHEATDILSPRGTPIVAMDEGNVVKLFTSKLGGLTVYQFDNQSNYCYYYAHLDRYAEGLKEGMLLRKGDKLGYVGSTGDADAKTPHLHLAINKLAQDKHWWQGTPLNPYPILMHILGK